MEHTPALLGHDLRGIREAFAKVLGGYHRLKEGSTAWALSAMTGDQTRPCRARP